MPAQTRTVLLIGSLAALAAATPGLATAQVACGGSTPFAVLHFTKTNTSERGFDHRTREQSARLFAELGELDNYAVTDTDDASVFDDATALAGYALIIFSNTSGNGLLDAAQRANVEAYVNAGGNFLGIHAATDTYRDGSWRFYNELVGGIVQNGPNHTANDYAGTMVHVGDHPTTANLPKPTWDKTEEYYYWERNGGELTGGIVPVLEVQSTGPNSYDAARPIAWVQDLSGGGRSFYTALGHAPGNYTDPANDFRRHLRDGLCWAIATAGALPVELLSVDVAPDPGGGLRFRWHTAGDPPARVDLYGGRDAASATALAAAEAPGARAGELAYRPGPGEGDYVYRLAFADGDGVVTLGDWLAAPGAREPERLEIRYATTGAPQLVVPEGLRDRPADLFDASGRHVRTLPLRDGPLGPGSLPPGAYWLRVGARPPLRLEWPPR